MNNPIYVLSALCLMVILAVYAGKTRFGSKFGAALLVIVFTAIIANLGLIPSASNSIPLYDGIFTYLAPLSIFYLLLGVNLNSIKKAGAPMIILFVLGSLATAVGVFAAWHLVSPQEVLGDDARVIAGMLAGTYTGGSANFNAVALEYNMQENGILFAGNHCRRQRNHDALDHCNPGNSGIHATVSQGTKGFSEHTWKPQSQKKSILTFDR